MKRLTLTFVLWTYDAGHPYTSIPDCTLSNYLYAAWLILGIWYAVSWIKLRKYAHFICMSAIGFNGYFRLNSRWPKPKPTKPGMTWNLKRNSLPAHVSLSGLRLLR